VESNRAFVGTDERGALQAAVACVFRETLELQRVFLPQVVFAQPREGGAAVAATRMGAVQHFATDSVARGHGVGEKILACQQALGAHVEHQAARIRGIGEGLCPLEGFPERGCGGLGGREGTQAEGDGESHAAAGATLLCAEHFQAELYRVSHLRRAEQGHQCGTRLCHHMRATFVKSLARLSQPLVGELVLRGIEIGR